jgi:hypothetical protein
MALALVSLIVILSGAVILANLPDLGIRRLGLGPALNTGVGLLLGGLVFGFVALPHPLAIADVIAGTFLVLMAAINTVRFARQPEPAIDTEKAVRNLRALIESVRATPGVSLGAENLEQRREGEITRFTCERRKQQGEPEIVLEPPVVRQVVGGTTSIQLSCAYMVAGADAGVAMGIVASAIVNNPLNPGDIIRFFRDLFLFRDLTQTGRRFDVEALLAWSISCRRSSGSCLIDYQVVPDAQQPSPRDQFLRADISAEPSFRTADILELRVDMGCAVGSPESLELSAGASGGAGQVGATLVYNGADVQDGPRPLQKYTWQCIRQALPA